MSKIVPNIVVSLAGLPKHGKTHLAFSFPEPIKVYSFNDGANRLKEKFPDKQITVAMFELPIIETDNPAPWAEPIWNDFQKTFKEDAYSGKYKTLIIDTGTELWGVLRQAITESKNRRKLLEVEYALPNLKMGAIYDHAKRAGVNLVSLNYLKDRYVNEKNTGELELSGWSQTEAKVDIVLEVTRVTKAGKTTNVTVIKDNWFDRDLNGKTLVDTNYDELVMLFFGG